MTRRIKIIIIIILIIVIFPLLTVTLYFFYLSKIYANALVEVPKMIQSNQNVEEAKILYDKEILEFCIEIDLVNNGKLRLERVNRKLKGRILVSRVGDFGIYISERYGYSRRIKLDLLSYITGHNLESVSDITENYDDIYSCVKKWTNISQLKETGDIYASQTIERYPDLFDCVVFNGEKYLLAVIDWNDKMNKEYHRMP